jgi:hypothetical protein
MDYTPVVLKNKAVSIRFYKVKKIQPENVWVREQTEEGEDIIESSFVKFTNNSIADIEDFFGGLEAWQEKLEKLPVNTIRQTLAFALRKDVEEVGEAMLDGEVVIYSNIIGTAWAIANGVDPTVASRMLQNSAQLAEEQRKQLNETLINQTLPDSPGPNGTASGPKRASRSKSSGS